MASGATNEIRPVVDSDEIHETAEVEQESSFHKEQNTIEETVNVTLELHEDDTRDFNYFSSLSDLFVECVVDVKARIKMLEEERMELLTQRSHASIRTSASKILKNSQRTSSSMRAAAEAATLHAKMNSLKRHQELDRKQELLKKQQKELERLEEQERLQGELDAAEAKRDVLERLERKIITQRHRRSEGRYF